MRNKTSILFIVVALLLVITPVLVGCAAEEPPPPPPSEKPGTPEVEKPDVLEMNVLADVTGPYSAVMGSMPFAAEDYELMVNKNGGILGVPIKVHFFDTRNDRAVVMSEYVKLKAEGAKWMMFGQLADSEMLVDRMTEDKIIQFGGTPSDKVLWPPRAYLGSCNAIPDDWGAFAKWLSQEWEKRGETEKCRLALLNPDNPTGHASSGPGLVEYIQSLPNIDLVANQRCDWRATDLTTDVIKLWQTEPHWIWCGNLYGLFTTFLKATTTIGIRDKVEIGTIGVNADPMLTIIGGAELMNGIVGTTGYMLTTDDNPGALAIKAQFKESNRNPKDFSWAYMHVAAHILPHGYKLLELTAKEHGWDGITYDNVINISETTERLDISTAPLWLAGKKHCSREVRMFKYFEDGAARATTDWEKMPVDIREEQYRKAEWGWKGFEVE